MDDRAQRERLGRLMQERRKVLRLSVREAARRAGFDRATWDAAEEARRRLSEYNYAGVEDALEWARGSVDDILAGREPTLREHDTQSTVDLDEEIELVRSDPKLSPDMQARIIGLILERRERARVASIEETRRVIDLFRGERSA